MSYLQWSDDYLVGVEEIDDQHRRLVELLNELHDAMLEGRGKQILGSTLDGLIDYTVTHFGTEEGYFDAFDYPRADEHKAQHSAFVAKVGDFRQGFDEDRLMVSIEVMDFLSDWLVEHIKGSDKAFGPYLNERGVE